MVYVPVYKEIIVKNVFPGIDARFYLESQSYCSVGINSTSTLLFRYDFIVNPGANVSDIIISADLGKTLTKLCTVSDDKLLDGIAGKDREVSLHGLGWRDYGTSTSIQLWQ